MASIPKTRKLPGVAAAWRSRWSAVSAREQRLVFIATAVVGLAVLWLALLRPALHTLGTAPGEIAQLQTTLREAQAQAQDLATLAAAPAVAAKAGDLRRALSDWVHEHDPQAQAQITVLPGSVTLDVKSMKPQTVLELAQAARRDWGATLAQAQLVRGGDGLMAGHVQLSQQQSAGGS
ncbi:MAG: type II secretion system protein M [Proteobacteria bacterium]|nr:type II secretion system protein M [Pseudomonadota bacterium]